MTIKNVTTCAASPLVNGIWLLLSAAVLTAAWKIEPYAFAYATFGALVISGVLVIITVSAAMKTQTARYRYIAIAFTGALPSLISFLLLKSANWA